MICEHARHHLDAYVRGELDTATSAEVKVHLAACATCRSEEALARQLARNLRALHRDAPASLAAKVLAARPQRRVAWFSPARALAATLLLAGIVFATSEGRQWFTKEAYDEFTSSPSQASPAELLGEIKPGDAEMKAAPNLPALEPSKGKLPAPAAPARPQPLAPRDREQLHPVPPPAAVIAPVEQEAIGAQKSLAVPAAEGLLYEAAPADVIRRDEVNQPAGGASATRSAVPAPPAAPVAPAAAAPAGSGRTFGITATEEDKRELPVARAPQRSLRMKESADTFFVDQDSMPGVVRGDTGTVDTGVAAH